MNDWKMTACSTPGPRRLARLDGDGNGSAQVSASPSSKARDARRGAAVLLAALLLVAVVTVVVGRTIVRGLDAFPDLRVTGSAASASSGAAPVAPATADADDGTAQIRGRILDADGNAVAGATVRLVAATSSQALLRDATSDAAGAFSFLHLDALVEGTRMAQVRVVADHDPEGAVTSAELAVERGRSQEITLVLAPGVVRGVVVDTDDHPVPGASVTMAGVSWFSRGATTDDAGAFRIASVPVEATTLVVVARGYATVRVDATRREEQAEIVVRVRLASAPPIEGDVHDADGVAVRARVTACAGQPSEVKTESGDDGTFELPASAVGCQAVAEKDNVTPSDLVTVTAGAHVSLRLKPAGAIEGVVVDERGRPLPSYAVSIESFSAALNGRAGFRGPKDFDDPGGAFRLENLQAGRFVLTATAPGKAPTRSDSIDVQGGATTRGIRIVLTAGGTVVGHVYDDRHAPLSGVDLRFDFVSSTVESASSTKSDDSGQYRLEGAPQGPFTLRAQKDGYRVLLLSGLRVDAKGTLAQDLSLHGLDGGPGLEFGGIGANVGQSPEGVTVSAVFPGDPADRAGLRAGDRIVRVDGDETDGMSLADVLQRLRGPAGTPVGVSVQRAGETIDLVIPRSVIVR
jgi:uncharacterized protein (DUF2249 family)